MGVLRDLQTDIEVSATRLFAEYRALLLAEAKVMGVAWDEAEDLVMITFEKYLSNKNNFDPSKGELITYLKKILHNTYVTSLRKKKSRIDTVYVSSEDLQLMADKIAAGETYDSPEDQEDDKLVRQAIASLSPKVREAIMLHYFEDKSIAETAQKLGISENAVKNRLFMARKALARKLKGKLGKALAILGICFLGFGVFAAAGGLSLFQSEDQSATLPEAVPVEAQVATPAELEEPPRAEPIAPITTFENNENTETKEEEPMKLTKTLKTATVAAAMTLVAVGSASADLPAGYTRLDYIEGDGKAWIASGVYPTAELVVQMTMEQTAGQQGVGERALFGNTWSPHGFIPIFSGASNSRIDFYSNGGYISYSPVKLNELYHLTFDAMGMTVVVGDAMTGTRCNLGNSTFSAIDAPLRIFSSDDTREPSLYRIHSMKMTVNGVCVRDFIPVKAANGDVGLYDLADHSGEQGYVPFYKNSNPDHPEANFIAGPEYKEDPSPKFSAEVKSVGETEVTVVLKLPSIGDGATSATVSYAVAPKDEELPSPTAVESAATSGWEGNVTISGLEKSRRYIMRFSAQNDLNVASNIEFMVITKTGLKVTVIGDSYSTYVGTMPSGYVNWYTGSNNGVTSVEMTWWKQFINQIGGKVEVNNAWSGSWVCGSSGSAMISDSRLNLLGNPNIVLICGGTNDSWNNANLGTILYHDNLADYTPAEKNTFAPAFAYLIQSVKAKCPNATIIVVINSYDDGNAGIQKTFCDAMAEIAEHFGVLSVQLHDISKAGSHPDAAGMTAMADQVFDVWINSEGAGEGGESEGEGAGEGGESEGEGEGEGEGGEGEGEGEGEGSEGEGEGGEGEGEGEGDEPSIVQSGKLPAGYTQLDYIEGTGASWINSGVTPTAELVVKMTMEQTAANQVQGECALFGNQWSGTGYVPIFTGNKNSKIAFYSNGGAIHYSPINLGVLYHLTFDATGMTVVVGDSDIETRCNLPNQTFSANNAPLCLFGGFDSSHSCSSHRLYSMTMTVGGVCVREFVPAMDAQGNVGLYDLADHSSEPGYEPFYKSQGANNFIAGPVYTDYTVLFVVGAAPQKIDSSESPIGYGIVNVATGQVLSVPATLSFDNGTYRCAGYKLYRYVEADGDYVEMIERAGAGNSFTVQEGDVGTGRKLEWQWRYASIPEGYQLISSIRSTGTQYIDTGIVPGNKTTLEMDFNTGAFGNNTAFFGQSWGPSAYLFCEYGTQFWFYGNAHDAGDFVADADAHASVTDDDVFVLTIGDGTPRIVPTTRATQANMAMGIFATASGGNKAKWTLYSMQISEDGGVVRDFLPCRRLSDEAVGLLDCAYHGDADYDPFYPNKGSDSFVAGSDVDLAVNADHLQVWGAKKGKSVPVNAPDDPRGVYFSGRVFTGGDSPVHVYACLSRKDFGSNNANAWLAAKHKDLGVFGNGATVSGYLPAPGSGMYYGKLVAVREGDGAKAVSPQKFRAVVGAKTFAGEILIPSAVVSTARRIYDGKTVNFRVDGDKAGSTFVFPLGNLGGRLPVSMRLWPYATHVSRLRTAKVFVSFDNAEIASTDYCTTPRPIKTYADIPSEIAWAQVASFDDIDCFANADGFWELPLVDWANKEMVESFKKATYVKIEGIECDNCAEAELRLLRPSGFALIIR